MRSDQPMFQSYRGQAEVETLRPHPVELEGSGVNLGLASFARDDACLRAGNTFMSDGQAGEALDDVVLSPAEFRHPEDKNKIGEPARRRKVEKKKTRSSR